MSLSPLVFKCSVFGRSDRVLGEREGHCKYRFYYSRRSLMFTFTLQKEHVTLRNNMTCKRTTCFLLIVEVLGMTLLLGIPFLDRPHQPWVINPNQVLKFQSVFPNQNQAVKPHPVFPTNNVSGLKRTLKELYKIMQPFYDEMQKAARKFKKGKFKGNEPPVVNMVINAFEKDYFR